MHKRSISRNRLSYEYEPEVDPLMEMSEFEMERYFNVHIDESNLEYLVDKITSHATRSTCPNGIDYTTSKTIAAKLYSAIRCLLVTHNLNIHDAEAALHMDLSAKSLIKWVDRESADYTTYPIYKMIKSQLPIIICMKMGITQDEAKSQIDILTNKLVELDLETEKEFKQTEHLQQLLTELNAQKKTAKAMFDVQIRNLILDLCDDVDKFPYCMRSMYSRYKSRVDVCRELIHGLHYVYQLWIDTGDDDIPGQLYFNIGFNKKIKDHQKRSELVGGNSIIAAIEYICIFYSYLNYLIGPASRCYVSISGKKSTPDANHILYDIEEILSSIQTAIENYIISGTPVCIVLNFGYAAEFHKVIANSEVFGRYVSDECIRMIMEPIIIAIGINHFNKGAEYTELSDNCTVKMDEYCRSINSVRHNIRKSKQRQDDILKEKRQIKVKLSRLKMVIID